MPVMKVKLPLGKQRQGLHDLYAWQKEGEEVMGAGAGVKFGVKTGIKIGEEILGGASLMSC
jgi:hypothetical protein